MTELSRRIYEAVRQIPRGSVMSYGQVARLAGNPGAARAVGFALHRNPEPGVIPCHRVVFADGRLTGGFAFGGEGVQRRLLEEEGLITSHAGARSFAVVTSETVERCRAELVRGGAESWARAARGLGLGLDEALELIREVWDCSKEGEEP